MGREIFICYSRHDKALVLPLIEQINKELGKQCWIDLKGIESGEEFEEVIMQGIEESKVVLFMLSDASLKSPWTKREVYYAEDEGKHIVPILIDGDKLRGWFKFHFGNVDFVDIRSEEQKGKLLENLKSWLGKEEKRSVFVEEEWNTGKWDAEDWEHRKYHNSITHSSNYPRPIHQLIDNMILVEGGTFQMGIPKEHEQRMAELKWLNPFRRSLPRHQVTIEPFYIGKYPITQEEWECVMGNNPSKFKIRNGLFPIDGIYWDDCQEFIIQLNNLTGENFRLPTEAEWEFAARGGNVSHSYFYAGSNDIDDVAWYSGNSNKRTHEVGLKSPNELGLYDMSGNIEEWCSDWYDEYPSNQLSPIINPQGPSSGDGHVLRGGGWMGDKCECSIYSRYPTGLRDLDPENWGFRLVMDYNGIIVKSKNR